MMPAPFDTDANVTVTVYEKRTYRFADTTTRCPAHGQAMCVDCAQTAGTCECSFYVETGMHWDTCPGRARGTWLP